MDPMSEPRRRAAIARAAWWLAAMVSALPAGAVPTLLVAGQPEAPLRLLVDGGRAGVTSGGAEVPLAVPAGGQVYDFVATKGGWLAAGSVPVTGGRELAV